MIELLWTVGAVVSIVELFAVIYGLVKERRLERRETTLEKREDDLELRDKLRRRVLP